MACVMVVGEVATLYGGESPRARSMDGAEEEGGTRVAHRSRMDRMCAYILPKVDLLIRAVQSPRMILQPSASARRSSESHASNTVRTTTATRGIHEGGQYPGTCDGGLGKSNDFTHSPSSEKA